MCLGGLRKVTENLSGYLIIEPRLKLGKVKVKFTLEQAMKAQRGSRGIALLFL
jgi:hypothetical protein